MPARTLSIHALALCAAACVGSAFANDRPSVDGLHFDSSTSVLRIEGRNFRVPLKLAVNGQAEPLVVLSISDREITARVPAAMRDGSYSLLLVHGAGGKEHEELSLTIGVVGPFLDEKQ